MSRKMKLQLLLGTVITAVIVYFSFLVVKEFRMNVNFPSNVNWALVFLSVVIYMYSNFIRGLAYSKGIDPEMDNMTALEIVGLGHALNMVLPLHAGEGLRMVFFPSSYTVKRRTKLILISVLADAVVVIIISALTVPFAGVTDHTMLHVMWILLYCCIGLLVFMAALVYFVPQIKSYVSEYLNKSLLMMVMWVAMSWIILVAAFWLGLVAFGFNPIESIQMSFAVFVATNIVNLIPASPGGIGLFEYGTIIGLGSFGVEKSVALSASLLLHLIQYMALLPLGVFLYITAIHGKYGQAIRDALKKEKLK